MGLARGGSEQHDETKLAIVDDDQAICRLESTPEKSLSSMMGRQECYEPVD